MCNNHRVQPSTKRGRSYCPTETKRSKDKDSKPREKKYGSHLQSNKTVDLQSSVDILSGCFLYVRGIMKSHPGKSFLTFLQPLPCIHMIICSTLTISPVFLSRKLEPRGPPTPTAQCSLVKVLQALELSGLLVIQ